MRNGYSLAYTDNNGHGFEETQPWIHPSAPLKKKEILREIKFIENVVKPSVSIVFKVDMDNVPNDIDWNFVYENEVKLERNSDGDIIRID